MKKDTATSHGRKRFISGDACCPSAAPRDDTSGAVVVATATGFAPL
jgi:hypothetical protein